MANPFQTVKQLMSQGIEGYFAVKYAEFAKTSQHMQGEYRRLAERVGSLFNGGRLIEIGPGPAYVMSLTTKGSNRGNPQGGKHGFRRRCFEKTRSEG